MPLRLVDDELGLSAEIQLSPYGREAVGRQLERCCPPFEGSLYLCRLSFAMLNVIDSDLMPPTAAQVAYAKGIGKALGLTVPDDAFQFRGQMKEFLNYYVPLYEQHKHEKLLREAGQQSDREHP